MTYKRNTMGGGEAFAGRMEYNDSSYLMTAMATIALTATMLGSMYFVSRQSQKFSGDFSPTTEESSIAPDSLASRAMNHIGEAVKSFESKRVVINNPQAMEVPIEATSSDQKTSEVMEAPKPELSQTDTESYIWNYFRSRGYSPVATAAIMGNIKQESALKPHDRPMVVRNGAVFGGLGLAQWGGGRRQSLIATYPADYENIENQLAFICDELANRYQDVDNALKQTDNLSTAVGIFQTNYEKCDPTHCNFASRNDWAEKYLNKFANS